MSSSTGQAVRALCLAGPTASGKSAAAMLIAQRLGAEIISVDSALVYRGMDIGTAKPTSAERAAVPQHLIDIRDPLQAYSAAEFAADARSLIAQINARGHLALLVGGTMLYFKALFHGLDALPVADPGVRSELEAQAQVLGWPAMHAELARVDPVTAARLAANDSQRIQRALEVFRVSGQTLSALHAAKDHERRLHGMGELPLISLEPLDRAWLHERIAQRFDAMLGTGLIAEVQALRARGDLNADLPAMRCVGYRQTWEALDAQQARALDSPRDLHAAELAALRDKGIYATRQLAKRQLTWLRSMPQRRVVPCDAADALEQVLALAQLQRHPLATQ